MADRKRWPTTVYGHGDEPDPRFTLANERTFLAWLRTALGLLAGAAAVDALDLPLASGIKTTLAVLLAVAAVVAAATSWRSWAGRESALRDRRPLPANPAMALLLAVVVVVAVLLAVGAVLG